MTQLINKGGFRERANRSRKYKQSENEVTTLTPSQYQPQDKQTTVTNNAENNQTTDTNNKP
ncbi:hypothetical protein [Acinetobacter venetianus]|jgi:hypothetical protein|uniref:hypothetical protein n=1 Tax=Acinetobacter venetianus TaxID=52133 RepID=UPI000AFE5B50